MDAAYSCIVLHLPSIWLPRTNIHKSDNDIICEKPRFLPEYTALDREAAFMSENCSSAFSSTEAKYSTYFFKYTKLLWSNNHQIIIFLIRETSLELN